MLVEEYLKYGKNQRQSHLDLDEMCLERGGISTNHRGVLAQYLNTPIYGKPADLCHACNNDKCSNPKHLYWGTRQENIHDAIARGTFKGAWGSRVEKYGIDEARRMNARPGNTSAKGNKGKPKSEEHRRNISEGLKRAYPNRQRKRT